MFKNRAITIKMNKTKENETEGTAGDQENFEKKADVILHKLESLGAKMFLGICIYIVLDTHRQVAVARAIYHPQ